MVSSGSGNHGEGDTVVDSRPRDDNGTTWHDVGFDDDDESVMLLEKKPLLPTGSADAKRRPQGRCYVPKRYELLFMVFIGLGFLYGNRINISVTMAAMTNATYTSVDHEGGTNRSVETCSSPNTTTDGTSDTGEFLWSAHEQELVIASFFYGYVFTQIPAGWLTDKIGGTRLYGISLFISAVGCLLAPTAARSGPMYFVAVRILCGIGEGGSMPAIGSMLSRWFSGSKNSMAFAIALSGAKFGTFFGTIISGLLSSTTFLGGWPSTYYFFGALTITWTLLWSILIYESPHLHPRISREEFQELSSAAITEKTIKVAIPIKSILLSIPVWSLIICSFVGTWSNNTIFTNQPIYLKHVQGMDIEMIGILSSIPFAAEGSTLVISTIIANRLMDNKILSVIATRKILTFIGLALCAVSFLLLAYVGCNSALSVVLMTCAVGFNGICTAGYYVNMMDIAPRLAGTLVGLANTASALSSALAPYVVGVYTTTQSDIDGWQIVFFIASGLSVLACLVFLIFGSGEEQEWAKPAKDGT